MVGGSFTNLAGQFRTNIARLNANGTLDSTFDPGADGSVLSVAMQADGKILVGGTFTTLGGYSRNRIARLNADGTVDDIFNPGSNLQIFSLVVQPDGKIVVGGRFTSLGGQSITNIGRLNNTEPAAQALNYDGSNITWLRGGTSPEVWHTTFEHSPDGLAWSNLGTNARISGGWQLTGVLLPPNGTLRARGYTTDGRYNGSGGTVETTLSASWPLHLRAVRNGNSAVLSWTGGRGPYQVQ